MKCAHFGICGGCRYQDIAYSDQLRLKEEEVKKLMRAYGIETSLKPINHFDQWYYRNKMEYTFSEDDGSLVLGLHPRGQRKKVFNVEECPIFSRSAGEILNAVREFGSEKGYCAYNTFSHKGFLRHLVLRESKAADEIMVGLVTSTQNYLNTKDFVERLLNLTISKKVCSIEWVLNDSFGDAVTYQQRRLLYGEPFIKETLGSFEFMITLDAFFQTNPVGVQHLYRTITEHAPLQGKEQVLDLYCGQGAISLFLSPKAGFIWGVEVQKSAVETAVRTAQKNNIKNISFVCSDVRAFLGKTKLAGKISLIVINPPRCGLSKKIKERVLKLESPYLFYSSCNPKTLCADIGELMEQYSVEYMEPFDFFPHTPHLEVLAYLRKR